MAIRNPTAPAGAPSFNRSAAEKVMSARSILQAVIVAEDSGSAEGDATWALRVATELLERALEQMDEEESWRHRAEDLVTAGLAPPEKEGQP